MAAVNTTVPMTSGLCEETIARLTKEYPIIRRELLTTTENDRPIWAMVMGTGHRRVLYSGAHHANEWITAPVLLKFAQELAAAEQAGGEISGVSARELLAGATFYLIPMVDPDGVDLVTGQIPPGSREYQAARRIAAAFPQIPFPRGWRANLMGTDLNLNYPAGWQQARENKFALGYTKPAPRDYVGASPLNQRETRALAEYTKAVDPAVVLAYHAQGSVIYWQFQDIVVPGARELGERLARVSGYPLEDTPYASAFAGYKDWFIQEFRRPGYTIEVGRGENPLPLSQFDGIYQENLGILVTAALG